MTNRFRDVWCLSVVLAIVIVFSASFADADTGLRNEAATEFEELAATASIVAPLGINPLVALAALGVAAYSDLWAAPTGIDWIAHPACWICFSLLGLLMQFGRSFKLTKPVAELLGTGESLLAVVVVVLAVAPMFTRAVGPATQAGFSIGALATIAACITIVTIVVVRMAIDILIWLSPIPMVDLFFEVFKLTVTTGFLALAIWSPKVALGMNALFLLTAVIVAGWAIRTARFGITMVGDLTLGRFSRPSQLPRESDVPEDLGPFIAFVESVDGLPRRQRVHLVVNADHGYVLKGRKRARKSLGAADQAIFDSGVLGTTVTFENGVLFLPARYSGLIEELCQKTRGQMGRRGVPAAVSAV